MTICLSHDPNLIAPVDAPVFGSFADEPHANGIAGLLARVQVEHEAAVVRVLYSGPPEDVAPLLERLRHAVHRPRVWVDVCHVSNPGSLGNYLAEHDAHFFFHSIPPSAAVLQAMVAAAASGKPLGVRHLPFWNDLLGGFRPDNYVERRLLRDVGKAALHKAGSGIADFIGLIAGRRGSARP
jgi:hypothetical protein